MSEQILPISVARKELPRLPEQFEEQPGYATITRYGKPVMTVLPYSTYQFLLGTVESLRETIEALHDAE
ncbi:MAG TPA: type II toxin-antitoxin system Phd/YefM family antitoxin [Ktedonobacteraceae bacterium]